MCVIRMGLAQDDHDAKPINPLKRLLMEPTLTSSHFGPGVHVIDVPAMF